MYTEKKIIVAGNPKYGLAKSIKDKYSGATFYSRSNGFDFSKDNIKMQFTKLTLNYEIFISCSSLDDFNQLLLLKSVYDYWSEMKKGGHIFSIGSTVDTNRKSETRLYPIEKLALKEYVRNLSDISSYRMDQSHTNIKVSNIAPGYLDTKSMEKRFPGKQKIKCEYIVSLIQWILEQPKPININNISLDPMQNINH